MAVLLGGNLILIAAEAPRPGTKPAAPDRRPDGWAVKLERPGLPNLYRVNENLYRGAQPTAEGVEELKKLGVKTIVGLRFHHSDEKLLGSTGITFVSIPMTAQAPTEEEVVRFLQIVTDKTRQPVFVHCKHGSDRTGTMCAAYRVVIGGWTKQQAVDEMTKGGFGFHSVWVNLPKFVKSLDIERIKAKLKPKPKEDSAKK
jgi:protein tyrosine phosphatase (PTP) superfamily phosphohydrolase (DUF442 family)